MATCTGPRFLSFQVSCSLLFFLLICSLKKGNALERRESEEVHRHSLEISSLFPDSVCIPFTKAPLSTSSTLKVVHRHGPCSQLSQDKAKFPTRIQILTRDQSRVCSIQARLASNSTDSTLRNNKAAELPATSGAPLGTGDYIVTVGLGTPKKQLSLIFDTGSDLTWTQCQPCVVHCYQQQQLIFDPSESSTYANIPCSSTACADLLFSTGNQPRCSSNGTCIYTTQYGDGSYTQGYLGRETLTLTNSDVVPSFYFGCGENNNGLFGRVAGLLGLGRDRLSIVMQTAQKYGQYFSYCLPPPRSSSGYLTFGNTGVSSSLKFTPLNNLRGNTFYFITITAISVDGKTLATSPSVFATSGTIIDSGTVISRLPPGAYGPLKEAFKQFMVQYPSAPGVSIFDTCYDFSNYSSVTTPIVRFYFSGNVFVNIAPVGLFYVVSPSQVCLAFAPNSSPTDMAIFGNTQQQTLQIAYDVAGGKLGFAPGGC